MSTLMLRAPRRLAAATVSGALAAVALTVVSAAGPAQAATTGTVTGGTATWGLSTYLNSSNFGRPNPKADAYTAPATFDAGTRLSSWGAGTGIVAPDGSADLVFDGTSVNFAGTGGGWLRLSDLEADLDASGNGAVSAVVEYGTSTTGTPPAMQYDPTQAPTRGPEKVVLVNLAGNTAADVAIGDGQATYTGLDGTWSSAFTTFLSGGEGVDPWTYASTVSSADGRTPLPFTFSVSTETPAVTAQITSSTYADGVAVAVAGTGFRAVTNTGDAGVYLGIAESGALPDVSTPAAQAGFAAVAYATPRDIVDGAIAKTLVAPTDKLDPTKTYSVYTWQAHGHSNTTQDTETPLAIDWETLVEPVEPEPTVVVNTVGATGQRYGPSATLGVTVTGVDSATVTLTGLGARQNATVRNGSALFRAPGNLGIAWHTATFTVTGPALDAPVVKTVRFGVARPTVTIGTSVRKGPTPRATGSFLIEVKPHSNLGAAAPVATGHAAVSIYLGNRRIWHSGAKPLQNGKYTYTLPRLARGTYTVVVQYAGTSLFLPGTTHRTVGVR